MRISRQNNSSFFIPPSAFSLIELLITMVVAGMVLLALIMGFQESLKNLERQRDLSVAGLLSEELMNEIRSKPFGRAHADPAGADRRNFAFVDDYDHLTDAPPTTIEGVVLDNGSNFVRRVFVDCVSNDWISPAPTNAAVFKRITVVVGNAVIGITNVSVVSKYD